MREQLELILSGEDRGLKSTFDDGVLTVDRLNSAFERLRIQNISVSAAQKDFVTSSGQVATNQQLLAALSLQTTQELRDQIVAYDVLIERFQDDRTVTAALVAEKQRLQDVLNGTTSQVVGLGASTGQSRQAISSLAFAFEDASQFSLGFSQGMRAISNNLGPLSQQLGQVFKNAQTFRIGLRALLATLSGPEGILLAFSAATTVIALFGDEISELLPSFRSYDKAVSEAASSLIEITDASVRFQTSGDDLIKTFEDSETAVVELNKQIEELEANIGVIRLSRGRSGGIVVSEEDQEQLRDLISQVDDLEAKLRDQRTLQEAIGEEVESIRETRAGIAFLQEQGLGVAKEEVKTTEEGTKSLNSQRDQIVALNLELARSQGILRDEKAILDEIEQGIRDQIKAIEERNTRNRQREELTRQLERERGILNDEQAIFQRQTAQIQRQIELVRTLNQERAQQTALQLLVDPNLDLDALQEEIGTQIESLSLSGRLEIITQAILDGAAFEQQLGALVDRVEGNPLELNVLLPDSTLENVRELTELTRQLRAETEAANTENFRSFRAQAISAEELINLKGQVAETDARIAKEGAAFRREQEAGLAGILVAGAATFEGLSEAALRMAEDGSAAARTLFAVNKAASIASAVVNTYQAASKALAEGGPFLGPILAAAAIANGLALVARIRSTSVGSSSVSGGAGGVRGGGSRLVSTGNAQAVSNVDESGNPTQTQFTGGNTGGRSRSRRDTDSGFRSGNDDRTETGAGGVAERAPASSDTPFRSAERTPVASDLNRAFVDRAPVPSGIASPQAPEFPSAEEIATRLAPLTRALATAQPAIPASATQNLVASPAAQEIPLTLRVTSVDQSGNLLLALERQLRERSRSGGSSTLRVE